MSIDFLLNRFAENKDKPAIIYDDETLSYGWLYDQIKVESQRLSAPQVFLPIGGNIYPPNIVSFLVHLKMGWLSIPQDDASQASKLSKYFNHPLVKQTRPALLLKTSGSSGPPKIVLHDMNKILEKFKTPKRCMSSICFMKLDHIGGVNTLLYQLSNLGTIVIPKTRQPPVVLEAVEKHGVELLPVTPTFLRLILLSGAHREYDLSSLKKITYGTEPMPQWLLDKLNREFPEVAFQQTYGLTELGIMRSKSESSNSLWVKLGGEGFSIKVVDGLLYVKAASAMVGYLNATSPFTSDGWFNTGDQVETRGGYFKILGRDSDFINVGGEKVNPTEVEDVLEQIECVQSATVFGAPNDILGQMVCTKILLREGCNVFLAKNEIRAHCRRKLPRYKQPMRYKFVDGDLHSDRFKKVRS